MKYLSLFSGIGGFELGIEQAYEKLCIENLAKEEQERRQEKKNKEIGDTQGQLSEQFNKYPNRFTCIGYSKNNESNNEHAHISEGSKQEECPQGRKRSSNQHGVLLLTGDGTTPLCVGYSEIDPYAIKIYEKHFKHKNHGDVTKIEAKELPEYDLLVGGFPCQSFSIAGRRRGFDDTRGTLFFDIARILKENKPRYFLLENVKGLLSHDSGRTFKIIIATLNELGYDLQWQVLNSKNFGVPQNRERVFIIGHLRGTGRPKVFPLGGSSEEIKGTIHPCIDANYYKGYSNQRKMIELTKDKSDAQRVYDINGIAKTLKGLGGGQGAKTGLYAVASRSWPRTGKDDKNRQQRLEPRFDGVTNTLTGVEKDNWLSDGVKIRRLTPTECERLQSFPDGWTEGLSDTRRYQTLGNAVTVNVIEEIIKRLFNEQKN